MKIGHRKVTSTLIAAVAIAALAVPAQAASAATTPTLPPELIQEVTSVWTQNHVPASTQRALIAKMNAGQALDAGSGATPVKSKHSYENGYDVTVDTYADGSIGVVKLEHPKPVSDTLVLGGPTVTPMSVSNCQIKEAIAPGTVRWTGCTAYGWFTGVALAFVFTGTAYAQGGTTINSYWGKTVSAGPGVSVGEPWYEVTRQTQNYAGSAGMNLSVVWGTALGSGTTRLWLWGNNNNFWTN